MSQRSETNIVYTMNKFGGILMESHLIPEEVLKSEFFGTELRQLILMWKRRNFQSIEFIVNPKDSHIIPELIKNGFEFYLVAGSDLVLNRWIGEEPSRFPTKPSTFYSVCGMVVDPDGRILMVREQRRRKHWKFPGGSPIEDESLNETAARRVLQRTGVVAEAQAIIGVNHQNRAEYGSVSGLFFVCLMKYRERDRSIVRSGDIIDIRWFTREELRALDDQEFFAPHLYVFIDYEKWIRAGIVSKTGDVDVNIFSYLYRR